MPVFRPILPPRAGYVEVLDENGNHVYKPTPETQARLDRLNHQEEVNNDLIDTFAALLGITNEQKLIMAEQFRRAIQLYAFDLPEEKAIEIAMIYPTWEVGKVYSVGEIISYGINSVGDPQLYKVVQEHTSQEDWTPDATASLYEVFGLDESGYPIWSQPSGSHDAYNTGDIVNYNGTLYQSTIDGNVWSPDAYPAGWTVYSENVE